MQTLIAIALFVLVFLIYNFVNAAAGIAALLAVLAVFIWLKWPTILMLRGNSRYNKGDHAGGLALMEQAYKTGKLDSSMVVYYSYCLVRENQDDRATELLDEFIASGKGTKADICRAKHNKALILRNAGKTEEAFEVMKEVHADMPASDTFGTLGLIYLELADKNPELAEETESFLNEAYEYNSDDRTIACNLGDWNLRTGKLDEAESIYKNIVNHRQNSPTPYYSYARVLMEKGNYEDAEDMLNHALRYPFTGVTAIKREDVETALKTVEEKLAANKTDD
ncbi:MAG: tetratricopeptide repeat protein [Oscillospiraceae bacterium]|nr:tetratricopeptide repeat protein [Oscillospiraceae bacterium]